MGAKFTQKRLRELAEYVSKLLGMKLVILRYNDSLHLHDQTAGDNSVICAGTPRELIRYLQGMDKMFGELQRRITAADADPRSAEPWEMLLARLRKH